MMLDEHKHWWGNRNNDSIFDHVVFNLPVIADPESVISFLSAPCALIIHAKDTIFPPSSYYDKCKLGN